MDLNEITITPEQSSALVRIFERHVRDSHDLTFRNLGFLDWVDRDVVALHYANCLLAGVPGMHIGIERDGYAHT